MTPPRIQKLLDAIRMRAEAGVPLHKQKNEIIEGMREFVRWGLASVEQLSNAENGENQQSDCEAENSNAK